ncbi:methylmalonyl Co-A mutase-associated GTPase MeaB [bacterium CPR1]|nr:methylmalonyl Co-A mutase-associated GTPase MeaB [bacterium CPR1]
MRQPARRAAQQLRPAGAPRGPGRRAGRRVPDPQGRGLECSGDGEPGFPGGQGRLRPDFARQSGHRECSRAAGEVRRSALRSQHRAAGAGHGVSRSAQLVERILQGDRRAAARAISLLENHAPEARAIAEGLAGHRGKSFRVGITGPPGAGKSTLVDGLARELRKRDRTVGVVAVDPSSPFSGGALLGDRVRMGRALEDPGVFVRSMASRGTMGGLARSAQEAADVLDALGKDWVILETVGVGQSELAVAAACDVTVVVLVPEAGGAVQAMKAGLMEIADLFVVNKSDRPGADEMLAQLRETAHYLDREGWKVPILKVIAIQEQGLEALLDRLESYHAWLQEGERLEEKRLRQAALRIRDLVRARLEERLWLDPEVDAVVQENARHVLAGQLAVHQAAINVWGTVRERLTELEGI